MGIRRGGPEREAKGAKGTHLFWKGGRWEGNQVETVYDKTRKERRNARGREKGAKRFLQICELGGISPFYR